MIAIPNMDMPTNCAECFYGLRCKAVPRWVTADDSIPKSCPLIDIVRCGECKKVDTKKCPMYSAGWEYTDDDWCSEGKRRADESKSED